ncbi:MAG: MBL fold metallo-hydrolase [Clostridia bacterium]|nr:MBL fold metallo-hydrolase [Clostridia bacterium]
MKITWYGTASLGIESEKTKLLFDPFIRLNKKLTRLTLDDFKGFDHILLTHGHFDHLMYVPEIMKREPDITVYCTKTPEENLLSLGADKSNIRRISPGESFSLGDFSITVLRGKHIDFDMPYILSIIPKCALRLPQTLRLLRLIKKLPENNEIVSFVLQSENKTVLLLGSYGFCEDEKYPPNTDLMVFPFSGNSGIARMAAVRLDALRPKRLLFDHFDDAFPPLTKRMDVEDYCETVKKALPDIETVVPTEKVPYIF